MNSNKEKYIAFTDRKNEIKIINDSLDQLLHDHYFFKILSFYGMGGIGKSRFVEYAINNADISHQKLSYLKINLEIIKSDNILNAIFGLRKQIPTTCPCFDYAILNFWNRYSPHELNTEFSKTIFEQCLLSFSDKSDFSFKGVSIIPLVGSLISNIRKVCLDSVLYSEIDNMTYKEFIKKLPEYLGVDIRNKYFDNYLLVFVDAYEQYNNNWLEDFISSINYGVFIITSREKLTWSKINANEYLIKELPEDDTRELLGKYGITGRQCENIIAITECVPIYVELAINALSESTNAKNYLFKDKNDIIEQFFNHLSKEHQEILIVLSLVQVFNEEIFEKLAKELNIHFSILNYYEIESLSLVQNVSGFDDFYKIHDVVAFNIMETYNYKYRNKVFEKYLIVLEQCELTKTQNVMLYKHVLNLFIQNDFSLEKNICELILDLFFRAKGTLLPIEYKSVNAYESNLELRPIYYFTKAVYEERENSSTRLMWLNAIKNEKNVLGKHLRSYNIIHGYLVGLLDNQTELISTLNTINRMLMPNEINEWYYGQTKIFLGDYYVTQGKFKTAKELLETYQSELLNQNNPINNYLFQVNRHLGHLKRFNMFCCEAKEQYLKALNSVGLPSELQKMYIFTNYCETECLYDYNRIIKDSPSYLKICKKNHDLKSMAKIYCSLAIVHIKNKKYKNAKKCIRKSLFLNTIDGYQSGIMFSYLHQLYLERKTKNEFSKNTYLCFNNQLKRIDRYGYIQLPISILNNDIASMIEISKQYEWLDFNITVEGYRRFFDEIGLNY